MVKNIDMRKTEKQHQDFAYNYIDKVNELYEQLNMPVYGIYKVKNRMMLKDMQGLMKVLQGCSREEIKAIKEFFRKQKGVKK